MVRYLKLNRIAEKRFVYVETNEKSNFLENIYTSINKYCSLDSYVIVIDGLNELIGT